MTEISISNFFVTSISQQRRGMEILKRLLWIMICLKHLVKDNAKNTILGNTAEGKQTKKLLCVSTW